MKDYVLCCVHIFLTNGCLIIVLCTLILVSSLKNMCSSAIATLFSIDIFYRSVCFTDGLHAPQGHLEQAYESEEDGRRTSFTVCYNTVSPLAKSDSLEFIMIYLHLVFLNPV